VKIKNLKQPLQKYNNKRVVDKLLQTIYRWNDTQKQRY
jgi:hypothetical protein